MSFTIKIKINSKIKNSDGNIASELTNDPEMKFLLDNYTEYKQIQLERGINELKLIFTKHKKEIKSPVLQYIMDKPKEMNINSF